MPSTPERSTPSASTLSREEIARIEVGHTRVSSTLAALLVALFVVAIATVACVELARVKAQDGPTAWRRLGELRGAVPASVVEAHGSAWTRVVAANRTTLALFLESDRMGFLLDVVTPQLVDGQRDVVKNERRQSYENAPYGMSQVRLNELMYPKTHPYYWPVIGYMEDLTAATHDDVKEFFTKYYAPGNASLVIAGDINPAEARRKVEHWFSDVKPGAHLPPIEAPPVELTSVVKETMTDNVQLPRLTLAWHSPAHLRPGDAELDVLADVLAGSKNSRLYKRLVYDLQLVQDISAFQASSALTSQFMIVATARPSTDPPDQVLGRIKTIIDEEIEKLKATPPEAREVQRALNGIESSFLSRMQQSSSKADQMNSYYFATGNPDYFAEDLARYMSLQPNDIQAAARRWLPADRRIELAVHPKGKS
jgi:zinc protease